MSRILLTVAAVALALAPLPAQTQRTTIDLRVATAFPSADLADAVLDAGPGFGATIARRVQPHLHLYGGWDWQHFTADQSFAGSDLDFEETGYTFGLRFEHPWRDASRAFYRLEAGGTYKHIEVEDADGDLVVDSKHGLGYELGAGLLVPIGRGWRVAPTLRWRALSRDFEIGNVTTSGDLRYVGLELGLSRRF